MTYRTKKWACILSFCLLAVTVQAVRVDINNNPLRLSSHLTTTITVHNPWTADNVRHECSIFDMGGRLVWKRTLPETSNATVTFEWDGKNRSGRVVYSGIYIVHIRLENTSRNKEDEHKFRIAVLKR